MSLDKFTSYKKNGNKNILQDIYFHKEKKWVEIYNKVKDLHLRYDIKEDNQSMTKCRTCKRSISRISKNGHGVCTIKQRSDNIQVACSEIFLEHLVEKNIVDILQAYCGPITNVPLEDRDDPQNKFII